MKRREFITLLGGAAAAVRPVGAQGQSAQRIWRIGFLRAAPPSESELGAFLRALAARGYVQGRNFVLVPQWGDGNVERLSELAIAMVNQGTDIIVTEGTIVVQAAAAVTWTVPIVTTSAADPFMGGLIKNLSRPGGNVTGFASMERDVSSKVFEILKEWFRGSTGSPSSQHAPSGRCSHLAKTRLQKRSVSNTALSICHDRKRLTLQCFKRSLSGLRALWCAEALSFRPLTAA
jgi:ABC transporter substrate binding protein